MDEFKVKVDEVWSTSMNDEDQTQATLNRLQELTESSDCTAAIQGYIGIAAVMTISRLASCCNKSASIEASMHAIGVAMGNIIGMLDSEGKTQAISCMLKATETTLKIRKEMENDDRTTKH